MRQKKSPKVVGMKLGAHRRAGWNMISPIDIHLLSESSQELVGECLPDDDIASHCQRRRELLSQMRVVRRLHSHS